MNCEDFENYRKAQRRARLRTALVLGATAALMILCLLVGGSSLSAREKRLYDRVVRAHETLWQWKESLGINQDATVDPYRTGLIGVEWSPLSTTLGALEAKRTACDPRWAVAASRCFDELKIERGDRVVVLSSSSFPGMILNVLAALEERGADVVMVLSLGSSTWGANDPRAPWPILSARLREAGLLATKARYATLGGGGENGGGLGEESVAMMKEIAEADGTPLVIKESLKETIEWKAALIGELNPKVVINIGGGHSSLGDDGALNFAPGLHTRPSPDAGDGVMARALESGYPVIHILNMKELCARTKIPFDAPPSPFMRGRLSLLASLFGLVVFAAACIFSERWRMMR